jgi:hypothetical protein
MKGSRINCNANVVDKMSGLIILTGLVVGCVVFSFCVIIGSEITSVMPGCG